MVTNGNPSSVNIKLHCGSWKPSQGDSLNLPDHRYNIHTVKRDTGGLFDGGDTSFQLRLVHHDLYLGEKALVKRENVRFDLTKSDLCPSFVEDYTAKGVGLRVADSHTGNHCKDDFTTLETIR
ncbi:hypothetical protein Tco_1435239, partial [Tanacetum coccineum]